MSPPRRFWRSLLLYRGIARWGNFTWLSPSVLLQSANDQVSKHLDSTIVNRRRMRWVAAQRASASGRDPNRPARLAGKRMVLLGDPGEMDASQYVLLRDLFATNADALLLMSDIIYPAGDINAWRDGVYLPYFGLPWWEWQAAIGDWRRDSSVKRADWPVPPGWQVFATPGNHDWYDGLTGFMFHSCGAEPLARVDYSNQGLSRQQLLSRLLWQRSARPDRAILDPLRLEMAKRWDPSTADAHSPGPMPYQPGPYFSIELEREPPGPGARRHALRLVCVDTGIDGSIDVEQAWWLRGQLRDEVPKVVVTGKPLVVDEKIDSFPIDGSQTLEPGRRACPSCDGARYEDLRDLIAEGNAVIACIAGDIHNAQRIILRGREVDDAEIERLWSEDRSPGTRPPIIKPKRHAPIAVEDPPHPPLPPLQIVAGGGGAYLTETHRVKLDEHGTLTIRDHRGQLDPVEVPAGRHTRFPSREESVLLFADQVHGWICLLALLLVGVGVAVAACLLGYVAKPAETRFEGDLSISTWRAAVGAYAAAGLFVMVPMLFATKRPLQALMRWSVWIPLVCLIGLFVFGWWEATLRDAGFLLVGAALVIGIPLLLIGAPLVRAYPSLRRLFPIRTALVAGAAGLAITGYNALLVAAGLAGVLIAYWTLNTVRRKAWRLVQMWALRGEHGVLRSGYLILSMWPIAVVGFLVWWVPEHLFNLDYDGEEFFHLIGAGDLFILFVGLTGMCFWSLWKVRRSAPIWLLLVMLAGLLGAGTAAWFLLDPLFIPVWEPRGADGIRAFFVGIGTALGLAGLAVCAFGSGAPSAERVKDALGARDFKGECSRSMPLFRAMAVAGLPLIGQLAESTSPPFRKSFLVIDLLKDDRPDVLRLKFSIFGVNDERQTGVHGHPATRASNAPRGSYPVDEVEVRVPLEALVRREPVTTLDPP